MPLEELIILLPCHSLDDFPIHVVGEEAQGLLAAWTALWHPGLLRAAGRMPTWYRADSPPEQFAGRAIVVPPMVEGSLLAGYLDRAQTGGATIVRKQADRHTIVAALLAGLDDEPRTLAERLDPERVADFLALGYLYLVVELLTRRIRYMSVIDETHFQSLVLGAATSLGDGDLLAADESFQKCLDVLTEARDQVYAADFHLIDLTLVASTTLGASLRSEIAAATTINVLLTGKVLDEMAEREPQSLAELRDAVTSERVGLVGGDWDEDELPLLDLEETLAGFTLGLAAFNTHLGREPRVYGRRRFGLTATLPQVLSKLSYVGALHVTFDDGKTPQADQSKTRWEGVDGSVIDALPKIPLDASADEAFVSLATKLADAIHHEHIAACVFAHWPGQTTPWYSDLKRLHAKAPILGKFTTLEAYFTQTDSPWSTSKYQPDEYASPYLRQAVIRRQADPISRHVERRRLQGQHATREALTTFAAALGGPLDSDPTAAATTVAQQIPRTGTPTDGRLVLNPLTMPRRVIIPVSGSHQVVSETPACGFAWNPANNSAPMPAAAQTSKSWFRRAVPQTPHEQTTIRNEFLEVFVHPVTGAIQSIRDLRFRGNVCGQQIALRSLPPPAPSDSWSADEPVYSIMAADSVEKTTTGDVLGELTSRGRLMDREGRLVARFVQRTRLPRGSRVVDLDIELDIIDEPRADPWRSYYACRFAWSDAAASVTRGVALGRHATELGRIESPDYIEIGQEPAKITVFADGLPYHQLAGMRMLDTLLVVRGETARRFRLGIGVDIAQPAAASLERLCDPIIVEQHAAPPTVGDASWLFHLDNKAAVVTSWNPCVENGRVVGVRVRLLETSGSGGSVRFSAFRPIVAAQSCDYRWNALEEFPVEEGRAVVPLAGHEWVALEARWSS